MSCGKIFINWLPVRFKILKTTGKVIQKQSFIKFLETAIRGGDIFRFRYFCIYFSWKTDWKIITYCIVRHKGLSNVFWIACLDMIIDCRWRLCNTGRWSYELCEIIKLNKIHPFIIHIIRNIDIKVTHKDEF